jgi:hypothetical protein
MWLTWHDSRDLWTLGGRICLSLQDLAQWTCIHEEMTSFGPSWGLWSLRIDENTTCLGHACDHHLHLERWVIAFGGTLTWLGDQFPSLFTWRLAFGGLNVTYLALDAIDEIRVSMEESLT